MSNNCTPPCGETQQCGCPCAAAQLSDWHDCHERAKNRYRLLYGESTHRAKFLTSVLDQFLRLLEQTAEARSEAWGNEGGAEEIAGMVSPPPLPAKLVRLVGLLAGKAV